MKVAQRYFSWWQNNAGCVYQRVQRAATTRCKVWPVDSFPLKVHLDATEIYTKCAYWMVLQRKSSSITNALESWTFFRFDCSCTGTTVYVFGQLSAGTQKKKNPPTNKNMEPEMQHLYLNHVKLLWSEFLIKENVLAYISNFLLFKSHVANKRTSSHARFK